jgi:MoaA/NifB/PqqE/SkfB family radical SAM enzyme
VELSLLYRGPLESCNYGCDYCPFAKKVDSRDELDADRRALERFVAWAAGWRGGTLGVLVTPWGEALIRRWYQDALVALSRMAHVRRAAIQTNLSGRLDWLARAEPSKVALWATYHPEWVARADFLSKVREVRAAGVRISVGAVGFARLVDEIEALRRELPDDVYLWVNVPKSSPAAWDESMLARLAEIDPLVHHNAVKHESRGQSCRGGASVLSVDGDGTLRRCHFVDEPLGNLYDDGWEAHVLRERPCPNDVCSCHIGYVHLDRLRLYPVYGDGLLERIPAAPIWRRDSR